MVFIPTLVAQVGVGTSSPTFGTKLDVVGTGNTDATSALRVRNSSSSTTSLLVRDDGSVGIGTTAPDQTLDLNGSALLTNNSNNQVVYVKSSYTGCTILGLENTSTGDAHWRFYSTGSGNGVGGGNLLFHNGSVWMMLNSSGTLAVGTTSPNNDFRLNVRGNILSYPSSGNADIYLRSTEGNSQYITFTEDGIADRGFLDIAQVMEI